MFVKSQTQNRTAGCSEWLAQKSNRNWVYPNDGIIGNLLSEAFKYNKYPKKSPGVVLVGGEILSLSKKYLGQILGTNHVAAFHYFFILNKQTNKKTLDNHDNFLVWQQ